MTKGATLSRLPNDIEARTKNPVRKRHRLKLCLRNDENTLGSISSSVIAWIILVDDFIDYKAAPILDSIIPMKTTHLWGQAISADNIY